MWYEEALTLNQSSEDCLGLSSDSTLTDYMN